MRTTHAPRCWTLYALIAVFAAGLGGPGTSASNSANAEQSSLQALAPAQGVQRSSLNPTSSEVGLRVSDAYGKLPLTFEANRGQTDSCVDFLARGPAYSVFLNGGEAVLSLNPSGSDEARSAAAQEGKRARAAKGAALRMKLIGAQARRGRGQEPLPGKINYFVGKDSSKWRTGIPTYARIAYEDVYPGVDVVYYGNQEGRLEHDFVVAPGTDPRVIGLRFEGAERIEIDAQGDLVLQTAAGPVRLHKPRIYQDARDGRREIAGSYKRKGRKQVGFLVGRYDESQPLIIDPVLVYSTYLGGSSSDPFDVVTSLDVTKITPLL